AHVVRLIMVLRANTLARGHSGVAPTTLRKLVQLFNKGVIPVVPAKGSVGASGDLAPLSHLALVLLGEGNAWYRGHRTSGARALKNAGIRPVKLGPKDALSLINGTQVTNAIGLAALVGAHDLVRSADIATAMTHEALRGSLRPFDTRVHDARPHPGQAATAANMRRLLRGSHVPKSHERPHGKLQDAYSLRCVPQVHGAARDALEHALRTALREANSTTDNPLVFDGGKH
ncbi:MAG: aromatic amino acid lyase, partial [Planctomycetota bacterium]